MHIIDEMNGYGAMASTMVSRTNIRVFQADIPHRCFVATEMSARTRHHSGAGLSRSTEDTDPRLSGERWPLGRSSGRFDVPSEKICRRRRKPS